jgi:hypothetical protein
MSEEPRDFLRRWSRLKREAASPKTNPEVEKNPEVKAEAEAQTQAPPPVPLPSVDSLTFESDFKGFMQGKVEEGIKRAALKKLFADPRFNVMDGLDTYIADYTKSDTIPEEMFERLARKREQLFNAAAEKAKAEAEAAMPQADDGAHHDGASNDVDRAQDPKAL